MIINFLQSKELLTLIYSALPVTELRATIPVAILSWKMNPILALFLAVVGNTIPIFIIMLSLDKLTELCSRYSKFLTKIIYIVLKKTRIKTFGKIEKYGLLALFFFVAIPLPGTGAWTGSIAAWLFGIKLRKAFLPILLGIITSGIIMVLLTLGIISTFKI